MKWWTVVTFSQLAWFSWTKTAISFYFKDYYIRNMFMKRKNICWRITLASTSLTRHPPPFNEEKNSPKFKDCQIFYVNRVFGVSKHWCSLISERKKVIFFDFLHMHSGKSKCLSYWFSVYTASLRMSSLNVSLWVRVLWINRLTDLNSTTTVNLVIRQHSGTFLLIDRFHIVNCPVQEHFTNMGISSLQVKVCKL